MIVGLEGMGDSMVETKVVISCMEWDKSMIDMIRQEDGMSDRARNILQAIREHLDDYLNLVLGTDTLTTRTKAEVE